MGTIITQAAGYVSVIVLGYLLRRFGVFKKEDFYIISRICLKITLPAAIISSLSSVKMEASMLFIALIGFGMCMLYVGLAFLMTIGKSKKQRGFEIVNLAAYNVGSFILPFVQGFLGPVGVAATSLFDTGNVFLCLGGSYAIASIVQGQSKKFSVKDLIMPLLRSVPFMTYIIMLPVAFLRIKLPYYVLNLAELMGKANPFLAMFMIGIGFELSADKANLGTLVRLLFVRYGIAIAAAAACFLFLPLPLESRQALVLLMVGPVSSAATIFTGELGNDVGLSSAFNSMSIIISLVLMIGALMIIL